MPTARLKILSRARSPRAARPPPTATSMAVRPCDGNLEPRCRRWCRSGAPARRPRWRGRAASCSLDALDGHDDSRRRLAEELDGAADRLDRRARCRRCRSSTRRASPRCRRRSNRARSAAARRPRPPVTSFSSAASRARSSAGASPRTSPWTAFRYSLPPSSPRSSPSRITASPLPWNARVSTRDASSISADDADDRRRVDRACRRSRCRG